MTFLLDATKQAKAELNLMLAEGVEVCPHGDYHTWVINRAEEIFKQTL